MLIDEIRERVKQALLNKRELEKDVLRVALGELQTAEARSGELSAGDEEKVLRKMVKSISESIGLIESDPAKAEQLDRLKQEKEILDALLPKTLSPDEIEAALAPAIDDIKGVDNDGQATGIAMKHLKSQGASVSGKDVSAVVRKLRA